MYIPIYLPIADEIHLVFSVSELDIASFMVQNLLMLSRQDGCVVPSNLEVAFEDAIEKREDLCLEFGREHREFAIRIIEAVIESHEKEDESEYAEPLKEFLDEIIFLERQYLH